jgi:hypothetical protein
MNSLPPSVWIDLILRLKNFSTKSLNRVNVEITSDLQLRGKTHEYRLKSSTMHRKYLLLLLEKRGAGPHTSRKRRSKGLLETDEVTCNTPYFKILSKIS